ncbi:MAG TPA: AIR synthase related protein [Candidatus Dormibacteraeota bacterium]|nr:AIR synthase related protein [Candidatus Dormibacteraeota bacterium]
MKIEGLGEFGLLERIKPYLSAHAGQDDAAVLEDATGFVVASCDMFVEGVHFDLAWMGAEDAGWRSLALALGDLAAKGATPWWALTSVALPNTWAVESLTGLYTGIAELAQQTKLLIAGGDMSSTDGPAVLSISVVGRAEKRPLARSEARPGWAVAVTGPLGASATALRERRAVRLVPPLEEGRRLNQAGLCCGDISDGLLREMDKFVAFSGCGCVIRAAEVPVADGATVEEALSSGEEAELVCVGPEDLIRSAGLLPFGFLTDDESVQVLGAGGKPMMLEQTGYDHFA